MQEMPLYNSDVDEEHIVLFAIIMFLKLKINLLNKTLQSNSFQWLISFQSAQTKSLYTWR